MKRRNDDTANIERREWNRLIFGDEYWDNFLPTTATLKTISIDDCKSMVSKLVRADNIVVAIAGAITRDEARALLDKSIGTLPKLEQPLPAIPQPEHTPTPGVYVVNKPDVNQGRVRIGHLGYKLGHPRAFDLMVGNDILGGGGFTARMMKKIRSDEGLTYGAYSRLSFPITIPGTFAATFQSKSSTCAYAAELTFELIGGMRTAPPTEEELTTSKSSFIETFPRTFESSTRTANLFAQGELLGRPQDYWQTYRDNVRKVTGANHREGDEDRPPPGQDGRARRRQHRGDHGRPPRPRCPHDRLRRDHHTSAARSIDSGADRQTDTTLIKRTGPDHRVWPCSFCVRRSLLALYPPP